MDIFRKQPFVVRGPKRQLIPEPFEGPCTYCVFENTPRYDCQLAAFLTEQRSVIQSLAQMINLSAVEITAHLPVYMQNSQEALVPLELLDEIYTSNFKIWFDMYFEDKVDVVPPPNSITNSFDENTYWFGGLADLSGWLINCGDMSINETLVRGFERSRLMSLQELSTESEVNDVTLIAICYRTNRSIEIGNEDIDVLRRLQCGLRLVVSHISDIDDK